GMVPLARLRSELDGRAASDLTPLPANEVPAELRDLVHAFNGMLERLDMSLHSIRRLTADASHQMRTPLSILRMHVSLLRKGQLNSEDLSSSVNDIEQASERLQRLLIQLLALARAENTVLAPDELETVALNALVAAVAADHATQAVQAQIDLQFVRSQDNPAIATQPFLATELIGNLIDNAIRYNRAGGMVAVMVEERVDGIAVVIRDDGPGIAPELRERVFTRFARLDRDSARTGSGLGLSIAATLAKAIGADLSLDTSPQGGLEVRIHFRRAPSGLTAP
ncbi:MAG: HAMP domain-containing sensor histidine kinase, partial [Novosphingobium sp.]